MQIKDLYTTTRMQTVGSMREIKILLFLISSLHVCEPGVDCVDDIYFLYFWSCAVRSVNYHNFVFCFKFFSKTHLLAKLFYSLDVVA